MKVLDDYVDTHSDAYKRNYEAMQKVNENLDKVTRDTMSVDTKEREKAKSKGKLLPRERINALVDPGTPFLELSQLAGHNLLEKGSIPSGNLITGIGVVNGR